MADATQAGSSQARLTLIQVRVLDYLTQTREDLCEIIHGLSETQWNFKPASDQWSIAEVLDHLTVIEGRVVRMVLKNIEAAPAAPAGRDFESEDSALTTMLLDRSAKLTSPEIATPTGKSTYEQNLKRFLSARQQTLELARTGQELRAHMLPHPILGMLDGYQWMLTVAGHTARHTQQILELKSDPRFPA